MTDLRAAVASQLPPGVSIKRDRGDALYITNAPAKGWNGDITGFDAVINGAMARIYPAGSTMEKCDFEPDTLANELARFRGASRESMLLFCACMKCVEAPDAAVYEKCDRAVRQAAARALRTGGGEGLYYCALALAEAGRKLKTE